MIALRELTVDDWDLWKRMRLAALAEAPYAFHTPLEDWVGATEDRWRSRLDVPGRFLAAELDGRPAGICCGLPPDGAGVADLLSLWVAPFARGHGVGDALVEAVVDWACEQGADRLALHVVEGNDAAGGLYRRHGFLDLGPVPGTETGTRPPERRMERVLTSSGVPLRRLTAPEGADQRSS